MNIQKIIKRLKRRVRFAGKQENAPRQKSLYHLPLLASYPRSGSNWVRYLVETVSGRPTAGTRVLVSGEDYILDRNHHAFKRMDRYGSVILVLRDYKECILRHLDDIWHENPDVEALLATTKHRHKPSLYIKNLKAFDEFSGDKHLVRYEDLMTDPQTTFLELSAFLGLDVSETETFIENLDSHFERSVATYRANGNESVTSASKNVTFHSKTKLSQEQVREFDDYYLTHFPLLTQKHLHQYRHSTIASVKGDLV